MSFEYCNFFTNEIYYNNDHEKIRMNQNNQCYNKCLICGSKEWIEREDNDGNSKICNIRGFNYSK